MGEDRQGYDHPTQPPKGPPTAPPLPDDDTWREIVPGVVLIGIPTPHVYLAVGDEAKVLRKLTPDEAETLALALAKAADEARGHNDGYEARIIRLKPGWVVMPIKLPSNDAVGYTANVSDRSPIR